MVAKPVLRHDLRCEPIEGGSREEEWQRSAAGRGDHGHCEQYGIVARRAKSKKTKAFRGALRIWKPCVRPDSRCAVACIAGPLRARSKSMPACVEALGERIAGRDGAF